MNSDTNSKILNPPVWALASFLGLLPWLIAQFNTALNTNHAWLSIAALRLTGGGHMVTDAYETNPPLSILMYFPVAFMVRLGIPIYYAPYVFGLIGLLASAGLVFYLLRFWPAVTRAASFVFIVAYIYAGALIPGRLYFGERDLFVLWGLVPFVMAQILITQNVVLPRWVNRLALPVCALMILIKPHFMAIPAILFMYRLWMRRDLASVLKSADTMVFLLTGLLYALVIYFFFWDYVTIIFPDFLKFYVSLRNPEIISLMLPTGTVIAILLLATPFLELPLGARRVTYVLATFSVIAMALYYVQGKGFVYHILPAQILTACAVTIVLYSLIIKLFGNNFFSHAMTIFFIVAFSYACFPINKPYLTHAEYAELKLPRMVKDCGPDCSFFMFSENMEMIWQSSIYSGAEHASRFPGLWWLHSMLYKGYDPADVNRYAGLIAEDLDRYKPDMLLIVNNLTVDEGKNFDFIAFHSGNPDFRAAMAHYQKTGVAKDDRGAYFKGTSLAEEFPLNYDVYVRSSVSSTR
jgi:hypothetical protein